jgi:hypothetical protein
MEYGVSQRFLGSLGRSFTFVLMFVLFLVPAWSQDLSTGQSAPSASLSVPRLIKFSSSLRDAAGQPRNGMVSVTFSIYADQDGGAPLWVETQNVTPDEAGRYTVLLGNTSATGLPLEIFANGAARWLSVQAEGDAESSRTIMVSVPYAIKALDAETLGGKPASAFVLADPVPTKDSLRLDTTSSTAATRTTETTAAVDNGGVSGTVNRVTKWTSGTNIGDSLIFDNGTNIGIGTTSPSNKLHVVGSASAFGAIRMQIQNTDSGGYTDIAVQNDGGGYAQFGITGSGVGGPFGNAVGTGSVYMQGGAATAFGTVVNAPFILGTNNIERFRITAAGNVGIGTANPSNLLHLVGTAPAAGAIRERIQNLSPTGYTDILVQNDTTGTAQFGITGSSVAGPFGNAVGAGSVYMQGGAATAFGTVVNAPFILGTNNIERFRITAAGNVGIGNSTPTEVLDVTGNVKATSFIGSGAGLTGVSASGLAAGTYANAYTFNNAGNSFTGNGAGLTNVTASGLAAGTYANALTLSNATNAITGVFTGNGAALTNVTAATLAAGTHSNAYTFSNASNSFTGTHSGNGSGLTNVTASGLAAGTYSNALTLNNASNSFTGTFSGNGAALTGVSASGLAAGTYANAYTFNNASNVFVGNGAGLTNVPASLSAGTDVTGNNTTFILRGQQNGSIAAGFFSVASPPPAALRGNALVTSGQAVGVLGTANSSTAEGVAGMNTAANGSSIGVLGITSTASTDSSNPGGNGVWGEATATTGNTAGVFGRSASVNGTGVFGQATATTGDAIGVYGTSAAAGGTGVFGEVTNTTAGVAGNVGVYGRVADSAANSAAGQFDVTGTANILIGRQGASPTNKFRVDSTGKGFFNGGTQTSGADFAESVAVRDDKSSYQPGDVIAIDTDGVRRFTKSAKPYSTLVAGIYSTKPGILATPHHIDDARPSSEEIPLAVVGIVPCKVSGENGPIEAGDLLVSSSTPGYAMKGTDRAKMNGAVIGKALQPMHGQNGVIEVLVSLQ